MQHLIYAFWCNSNGSRKYLIASTIKLSPNAYSSGVFGSYLINSPNKYLGEDVLVTGEIMEVCPMRGCWINVKDPNSDSNIRVKVTDGQIVFPLSSKGRSVNIQGEFSQLNFTEDQAIKWKVHLAEEKGTTLNPDDIIINQSDLVEYRIIGKGAKIYPYGCN